jgi:hypothetical protein
LFLIKPKDLIFELVIIGLFQKPLLSALGSEKILLVLFKTLVKIRTHILIGFDLHILQRGDFVKYESGLFEAWRIEFHEVCVGTGGARFRRIS